MASNKPLPFVFGQKSTNDLKFTLHCPQCSPPPPIVIDEDGDLTLQAGEFRCNHISRDTPGKPGEGEVAYGSFRVCPKTLSRASPVMKKMLYGGFAESKKSDNQPWTVHLPEDNAGALETILNIIHLRFDRVSSSVVTLDHLYNVTVLTDKYELTRMLQPWVGEWRQRILNVDKSHWVESLCDSGYYEKRLWIAWELGDLKDFADVLEWIASHTNISSSGGLMRPRVSTFAEEWFHDLTDPPGVYEIVSSTRLRIIEHLLRSLDVSVNNLICGKSMDLYCRSGSLVCSAAILGSVIQSLARAKLWPIPQPSNYDRSPSALLESMKNLSIIWPCAKAHCRDINLSRLQHPTVDMSPKLTDMHKRHCSEQAKKSGIAQLTG